MHWALSGRSKVGGLGAVRYEQWRASHFGVALSSSLGGGQHQSEGMRSCFGCRLSGNGNKGSSPKAVGTRRAQIKIRGCLFFLGWLACALAKKNKERPRVTTMEELQKP